MRRKKPSKNLKLCPLLHTPEFSKKADQLLVNLVGGAGFSIGETQLIMDRVTESFGKDANVVMGAVIDESLGDKVEICVIGTSDISDISIFRGRKKHRPSVLEADPAELTLPKNRKNKEIHAKKVKVEQDEFSFNEGDPRGNLKTRTDSYLRGRILTPPLFYGEG